MEFSLRSPSNKEFQTICEFIKEFELDNRDLKKQQFILAADGDQVLGFGRMRKHKDCEELCSLGVVASHRMNGIGKAIVQELIKSSTDAVFLVCIIPDFFIPLGFCVTEKYPASVRDKINYCTQELVVPESYVAMVFRNPSTCEAAGNS